MGIGIFDQIKMKYAIIFFIPLVLLSACRNQSGTLTTSGTETKDTIANSRREALHQLISKAPLLPDSDLTLTFTLGRELNYARFDPYSSDSLFGGWDPGYIYGMLHDTSRYYSILYYAAVEAGVLSLMVIDKSGIVRTDTLLQTGLYGSDCGYMWSGRVYVNRDKSFLVKDTVVSFFCDKGPPPDDMSLWKHEATTVSCHIDTAGKLIFADRTTAEFKPR